MRLRVDRRAMRCSVLTSVIFLQLVACAELKHADLSADGGTASSAGATEPAPDPRSSPKQDLPPGTGPGEHGSLPSGYCCASNEECRYGHCVGGTCLDECHGPSICTRPDLTFTCDGSPSAPGLCQPPAGFVCKPQAQFQRGTRLPGECCAATGDGTAGEECEGNLCIAIGDDPFVCTNRCTSTKDCPGGFICQAITDSRKECIPANRPYSCK